MRTTRWHQPVAKILSDCKKKKPEISGTAMIKYTHLDWNSGVEKTIFGQRFNTQSVAQCTRDLFYTQSPFILVETVLFGLPLQASVNKSCSFFYYYLIPYRRMCAHFSCLRRYIPWVDRIGRCIAQLSCSYLWSNSGSRASQCSLTVAAAAVAASAVIMHAGDRVEMRPIIIATR